jgi:hypothetical protein
MSRVLFQQVNQGGAVGMVDRQSFYQVEATQAAATVFS